MSDESRKLANFDVKIELVINAPPSRVWKGLTEEINDWWLPDFRICGKESILKQELFPGGRLFEESSDGTALLWGTLLHLVPDQKLVWAGIYSPDFGGPALAILTMLLKETDGKTHLTVTDSGFGHVTNLIGRQLEGGWKQLMETGLRPHCEKQS